MAKVSWELAPGEVIRRTNLHIGYGGRIRGGISPSRQTPNVLIFSDPKAGEEHGYIYDGWDPATPGLFHYTGEGQQGDQQMRSGNRAIRDHAEEGRALRVFRGVRGEVRYVGEFELAEPAYDLRPAHESGGTKIRQVLVFNLRAVELTPSDQSPTVEGDRQYRRAEPAPTAPPQPWTRDPNVLDRSLKAHADTQNGLRDFLASHGVNAWSPRSGEPDFDLAWVWRKEAYVCEVKSLPATGTDDRQLRLGIGQVLDYQALMAKQHERVHAVLATERRPADPRWALLCEAHHISLVWPDTFGVLMDRELT